MFLISSVRDRPHRNQQLSWLQDNIGRGLTAYCFYKFLGQTAYRFLYLDGNPDTTYMWSSHPGQVRWNCLFIQKVKIKKRNRYMHFERGWVSSLPVVCLTALFFLCCPFKLLTFGTAILYTWGLPKIISFTLCWNVLCHVIISVCWGPHTYFVREITERGRQLPGVYPT